MFEAKFCYKQAFTGPIKPHHQKSLLPLWSRQLKNAPCMNAASGRVCTIQPEETQNIYRHAIAWS